MKKRNIKQIEWINFRMSKLDETLTKEFFDYKFYKTESHFDLNRSNKSLFNAAATAKALAKYLKLL